MNYKKMVLTAAVSCLLLAGATSVGAVDNSSMISQLMQQIAALQSQLVALQNQQTGTAAWCHTFNANIGYANSGTDEVIALHTVLQKENISFSPDDSASYNEGTGAAVVQFQAKYGVRQTGFVGPLTRVKLNALYGCGNTEPRPVVALPTINFTANGSTGPITITSGSNVNLSWTSVNATTCNIYGLQSPVAPSVYNNYLVSGMMTVTPTTTTTYTVTCRNNILAGVTTANLTVNVTGTSQPSVGIASPNANDVWQMGSAYEIRWFADKFNTNEKVNIILIDARAGDSYYVIARDVLAYNNSSTGAGTPMGSYSWAIPTTGIIPGNSNSFKIYVGKFSPSNQTGDWVPLKPLAETGVYGYGNNFNIGAQNAKPIINAISAGAGGGQSAVVMQGQSTVIGINGYNFTGASGSLCGVNEGALSGITVTSCTVNPLTIGLVVNVNQNAIPGSRQLTVTTPNGISNAVTLTVLNSSINKSITLTSPNGGENWKFGETHRITWTSSNVDRVALYIYNDTIIGSGSTNYLDSAGVSLSVPASQGYFDWTISQNWLPRPTAGNENRYKVSISDVNASATGVRDTSDNYFTIAAPSTTLAPIISTFTATPVTVVAGQPVTLAWTLSGGYPTNLMIDNAVGSVIGTTSTVVYPTINTTYTLTARNSAGTATAQTSVVIRVMHPAITLASPAGGEQWMWGSTHAITWTATDVANVEIDLINTTGGAYKLATLAASAGTYNWMVGSTFSGTNVDLGQYKIRVYDLTNGSITSTSNSVAITAVVSPTVTLTSPNGGENLMLDHTYAITWNTTGYDSNDLIQLVLTQTAANTANPTSGAYRHTIAMNIKNTGSYSWTLPTGAAMVPLSGLSNDYVIEIFAKKASAASYGTPTDKSDASFSIVRSN